ncbi:hypothetical protein RB595_008049 [Gaeumannomyces hyphopodioides]
MGLAFCQLVALGRLEIPALSLPPHNPRGPRLTPRAPVELERMSHMSALQSVKFVPPGGHRACANCSISKARCITPEGATKCERCERLNKACHPKAKSQRRRRQPTEPAQDASGASSVASGPAFSHIAAPTLSALPDGPPARRSSSSTARRSSVSASSAGSSGASRQQQQGAKALPTQNPQRSTRSIMDLAATEASLVGKQAEILVAEFVKHRARHCLAVDLPRDATVARLKKEHPLVFPIMVMAANYYDHESQHRLFNRLVSFFVEEITQTGEKSHQLLAATICLLDCMHVTKLPNPQQLGLIHLTLTMSSDLGLERLPRPHPSSGPRDAGAGVCGPFGATGAQSRPTLESCRALAASYHTICLFLMSMGLGPSLHWPLHWSPHLTEAISELERANGGWSTNDGYLAAMTRLLQIMAQATEGHVDPDTEAPLPVDLGAAEAKIDEFLRSMPREFHEDAMAMAEYHNVRILLYKHSIPGISNSLFVMPNMVIPQREAQYRCLTSIRAIFRLYYSIPDHRLVHLPGWFWGFLQNTNVALGRLADLAAAQQGRRGGWPPDFVRSAQDNDRLWNFAEHMENLARRLEGVRAAMMATGEVSNNSMFDRWAELIRAAPGHEPFQQPRGAEPVVTEPQVAIIESQPPQFAALDVRLPHAPGLGEQQRPQEIFQFDPNAWASAPNDWTWFDWYETAPVPVYMPYDDQQQQGDPNYPGGSQPGWYAPPPS